MEELLSEILGVADPTENYEESPLLGPLLKEPIRIGYTKDGTPVEILGEGKIRIGNYIYYDCQYVSASLRNRSGEPLQIDIEATSEAESGVFPKLP